jgi:hypothetical protein
VNVIIGIPSDDRERPVVGLTSPKDGEKFTGARSVKLGGKATDDIKLRYIYLNNSKAWKRYDVSGKEIDLSKYEVDVNGLTGVIPIKVVAEDATGKVSDWITVNVSIAAGDREKPVVNLTSPRNGDKIAAGATSVKLAGRATDDVNLKYIWYHAGGKGWKRSEVNGKEVDLSRYEVDVSGLTDTVPIEVAAEDATGKVSTWAAVKVVIARPADKAVPVINLGSPVNGQKVAAGRISFAGSVTDDVNLRTIYIFDGRKYAQYNVSGKQVNLANYSADLIGLKGRRVTVGVYAYDASGKVAYKFVTINVY